MGYFNVQVCCTPYKNRNMATTQTIARNTAGNCYTTIHDFSSVPSLRNKEKTFIIFNN